MDLVLYFKGTRDRFTLTEATRLQRQLILLLRPAIRSVQEIPLGSYSSTRRVPPSPGNEGSMCAQAHFGTSCFEISMQAR